MGALTFYYFHPFTPNTKIVIRGHHFMNSREINFLDGTSSLSLEAMGLCSQMKTKGSHL